MKRPRVILKCAAAPYAIPGERIIEVGGERGLGFLLSLTSREDGTMRVCLYRADPSLVTVHKRRAGEGVVLTIGARP